MRKRRVRAAAIGAAVLAVVAAGYGIHRLSYLPLFAIQDIAVEGTERLPPQLVGAYASAALADGSYRFFSRENSMLYPRETLENAVEDFFPGISDVRVSITSLINPSLVLSVAERSPFALWCGGVSTDVMEAQDACYAMDGDGFVFATKSQLLREPETPYIFRGGIAAGESPVGETFVGDRVHNVFRLLASLAEEGYEPLGAQVLDENDFIVDLAHGFSVKASFASDPDKLARDLALLFASEPLAGRESEIDYIDMRFGNRVYVAWEGGGDGGI